MQPDPDEFLAVFNQFFEFFGPTISIGMGVAFGVAVVFVISSAVTRMITEAFQATDFDHLTVTDQRKKKKNDYLDYYDQLLEQDQGDPAIAYYDEVISEEMHR